MLARPAHSAGSHPFAKAPATLHRARMLTLLCRIVCAALAVALFAPVVLAATDCSGREHIRLTRPVHIDPDVRQTLPAAAPRHLVAVDAPPMVRYDTQRRAYEGIAVDILCFIAAELDIPFVIEARCLSTMMSVFFMPRDSIL